LARNRFALSAPHPPDLKERLTTLGASEEHFLLLDSNAYPDRLGRFDWLCGWGSQAELQASVHSLPELRAFHRQQRDWCLGHLAFETKNELEPLPIAEENDAFWPVPHLRFFVPQTLVYAQNQEIWVESYRYSSPADLLKDLPLAEKQAAVLPAFQPSQSKSNYLEQVNALLRELQFGNIYEINYCTQFEAEGPLAPAAVFNLLNARHQAPMSAYYRHESGHLLCFSPERYLQKRGALLYSQPIKGTAARFSDREKDQAAREALLASEKERAENVMIVDLVRNDLSRTAKPGQVHVEELFGLYPFRAVHQMISTVRSEMEAHFDFVDALATTFPMGSMTGAPKISALQRIHRHERFRRGLYSGSLGYVDPAGDFDFNVVIRSLQYRQDLQRSVVRVGSAITIHCEPEAEYAECLLKAEKLIRL